MNLDQYDLIRNSAIGSASILDKNDIDEMMDRRLSYRFTEKNFQFLFDKMNTKKDQFSTKVESFMDSIANYLGEDDG